MSCCRCSRARSTTIRDFRLWCTLQAGRRLARMSASEGSPVIAKSVSVLDLRVHALVKDGGQGAPPIPCAIDAARGGSAMERGVLHAFTLRMNVFLQP